MSDYTKATNFTSKDSLSSGNPLKIVKGTEIDTEFNNIQTAIATKTDNATAAITGGSITGITDLAVADGGTGASTASGARTNLSAASSGANSDITSITGLTTPLTVAQGGIGAATLTANYVLLGNGTSAPQTIAPSTSGNVLTSNGTTWASTAPSFNGTVTSVSGTNGLTGTVTTSGSLSIDTSTYAIGQCSIARPNNATLYSVGNTISGSSLYTGGGSIVWTTAGSGAWTSPYGNPTTNPTLINTGTWKCISQATQVNDGCRNYGIMGLWVRIS